MCRWEDGGHHRGYFRETIYGAIAVPRTLLLQPSPAEAVKKVKGLGYC